MKYDRTQRQSETQQKGPLLDCPPEVVRPYAHAREEMTLTWVNEGRCYPLCKDGHCCLLLKVAYFAAIGETRSKFTLSAHSE